ncbi:MAG: hypothetical protein KF807_09305 [Xanthobacteraceae bacterium]|nr:hypothetical protein [Xanthobacteraceae bacterium]
MIRAFFTLLVCTIVAAPVTGAAADCTKFAWPPEQQQKLLQQDNKPRIETGNAVTEFLGRAFVLRLDSFSNAKLEKSPERTPRIEKSFAGLIRVKFPVTGIVTIALTNNSWIDVIQDGKYLRPAGNTGAEGCPGVRKIVKFKVEAGDVAIQFSGSETPELAFAITAETDAR